MKKRTNVVEPPRLDQEFNFWKDNSNDKHFTLTQQELMTKFIDWKVAQLLSEERGESWYEYYYGSQLLRCFITDKETKKGLQSVFEEKEFNDMYSTIRHLLDHKN